MTEQDVDIVDRLRDTSHGVRLSREAAAEIERLRRGREAASAALERLGKAYNDMLARAEKAEADARTAYARGIEDAASHLDRLAGESPVGHENPERGASTHNWLKAAARAVRALAPDPEERQ